MRSGKYAEPEVVSIGGKAITRPRALTECGAEATSVDYSCTPARDAIRDGRATEMCRACRSKLEAAFGWRDLSHLPDDGGSSTPEQRGLIHDLIAEGYQKGSCRFMMNGHTIDQLSSREAAAKIDGLKADKDKGWKRLPYRPRAFADTALNDLIAALPKNFGTRAENAIINRHITTLAELNATDPYVLFSAKNAGVGAIQVLLDAGVWPGVSLSRATRNGKKTSVLCSNCFSYEHGRCCAQCGKIHKPARRHFKRCSPKCERAAKVRR